MVTDHKCMAHSRNIIATHEIGKGTGKRKQRKEKKGSRYREEGNTGRGKREKGGGDKAREQT